MDNESYPVHELQGSSGEYRREQANKYYLDNYVNDIEVMQNEEWRYIAQYGDKYQVSNLGRVRRMHRKIHPTKGMIIELNKIRLVKPSANTDGYLELTLYDSDSRGKNHAIHRLVAEAFIANDNNLPVVNHIDGYPWHNEVFNLEWCTYKHNSQHAVKSGLVSHKPNNSPEEIEKAWKKSVAVRIKPVYCLEDDIIYPSVICAEKAANNGKAFGNLSTALTKNEGLFRGKHYRYVNE